MASIEQIKAVRALLNLGIEVPSREDVLRCSQAAQADITHRARSDLARRYRANPAPWPQGIDHKANRWYNAADRPAPSPAALAALRYPQAAEVRCRSRAELNQIRAPL
jgi:hypothetical protein